MKIEFVGIAVVAFLSLGFLGCSSTQAPQSADKLTSGVYLDNRNTTLRPQDDFFHYVNGGWLNAHEIPADKSSDGGFDRLREEADADVRSIIETVAAKGRNGSEKEQQIALLYNSFMDEETVNTAASAPLQAHLARIDAIEEKSGLLSQFAHSNFAGVKSPLEITVHQDFLEPDVYRVYLFQSGLGLPNSDFYSDDSDKGKAIIAAYQAYVLAMYQKLGYSPELAQQAMADSWELEARLASFHRPPESNRNYPLWHNLYGPAHAPLPAETPWNAYLAAFGLSTDTTISVAQPEYIEGFSQVLNETGLSVWKDYLKLRLVSSSAPYLGQDFQNLSFDFYSKTLMGTPQMKPRWQRAVNFVNSSVGESVGEIYVDQHFSSTAKARMDVLVNNLVIAYRESMTSLDWMSEETRANALVKLEKFTPNIGYPDTWKDYSTMQLGDDLLANARAANRWELEREFSKLGKPVDKKEWSMSPQTVNAYYSPVQNSINFPAAILQAPFFDPSFDDAVNYGAIGSVIGHEIGHGFDDSGAQFDGDGRLHNWWTDDDRAAFKARTEKLIEQYDDFEVLPGVSVNGAFTQGENIGDLSGVSIAYKAYLNSLNGEPAPVMDGYTGQQRFFIGFAQAFMGQAREERIRQMIKTDVHSPVIFRVNGTLSNVDGFYEAFDVQADDALYRPEPERVSIW